MSQYLNIHRYMLNQMKDDERRSFEASLQFDSELSRLVQNYHSIEEINILMLESHLMREVEERAKNIKVKRTFNWPIYILLILLLILSIVFYFIFR